MPNHIFFLYAVEKQSNLLFQVVVGREKTDQSYYNISL